jgi:hypothetical protein
MQTAKWSNLPNAGADRKSLRAVGMKLSQQDESWRIGPIMSPVAEVEWGVSDNETTLYQARRNLWRPHKDSRRSLPQAFDR